ncbi:MAG: hypothetical protein JWO68_4277 [Actinomycetia bacterium]|nr:hypothetical protein [Actinomycetes bacterium]
MTYIHNPFRKRMTEQQSDHSQFLRTFGAGMLETLPDQESAWDRLVVIRSAPGAGKTSILRILEPASLVTIAANEGREDALAAIQEPLRERGAITGSSPAVLGILVNVAKDYRSLIDLGPSGPSAHKVFLKLLDARIIDKAIEAALVSQALSYPQAADRISFRIPESKDGETALSALRQMTTGGTGEPMDLASRTISGKDLLASARQRESSVLALIDSLLPVRWDDEGGHSTLYSLAFLGNAEMSIDNRIVDLRPVLLFDDVHALGPDQREVLYHQLLDRGLRVGRWIAERKPTETDDDILEGAHSGRDYNLISLEDALVTGTGGGRNGRLEKVLSGIADSRAAAPLSSVHIAEAFTTLLQGSHNIPPEDARAALVSAEHNFELLCSANPKYRPWLHDARSRQSDQTALEAAIDIRELEILAQRDISRAAPTLFDLDVDPGDPDGMSSGKTREAARLFLAKETGTPYYFGRDMLAELSSRNVEQYLTLSGDLFDLMIASVTISSRRGAALNPEEQHRRILRASRDLWRAIPKRVPFGADVVALLHAIADYSNYETYRPTAPYAPGVTGTALEYFEGQQILKRSHRDLTLPTSRLGRALGIAVANNLLQMSPDPVQNKGRPSWVFYMNRLLCPYFELPLQRGGFREISAVKLSARLEIAAATGLTESLPDPSVSLSGMEAWPR